MTATVTRLKVARQMHQAIMHRSLTHGIEITIAQGDTYLFQMLVTEWQAIAPPSPLASPSTPQLKGF